YLYRIAEDNNIPYPKTKEFDSLKEISDDCIDIMPPYIVKPQETVSQNLLNEKGIHSYHRTQKFESKEALTRWIKLLLDKDVDIPVLIQEFIPGTAETLYTLTSYSNKDGRMLAGSVGHKLRQFPPEAGRITSGVLEKNINVYEIGQKFLSVVGYHGLANTEFKFDSRDRKYKLMEINTRLGAWNYSTLYSGLNLIDVAIKDTLGITYGGPSSSNKNDGAIWYNLIYDLPSALYMNKKFDNGKFKLSFKEWRKSLKNNSFEAVWSWKDPIPFVSYLWNMGKRTIKDL
ncbi:MAG: ATP-grasp domain-containing protein, partial [Muribaculaceae bacterium]|nr:ATP-grasp domain-containing protein [Muribaculaceae bacterium]